MPIPSLCDLRMLQNRILLAAITQISKKGNWVVVETAQGIEMGEVDADALSIDRYNLHMPTKPIIRIATEKRPKDVR